jgi:hypothetical protein
MLGIGRRFLERRSAPRYTASKNSNILFRNRSCQMKCTVVDLSNTGARLMPSDPGLLPNEFELVLSPGQQLKCEAIHRTDKEIGVRFLSR